MTDTLAKLFDNVPPDLASYFAIVSAGAFAARNELELNLLSVADAVRWTEDFRDFHPIVQVLDGVILDDPNTSNHHVYLSKPPCAGMVLYLNHDGDSRIVFPTLASFLETAHQAVQTGTWLETFHPETDILVTDQSGLSSLIGGLCDGQYDCDATLVVVALIPSMDLTDLTLLQRLVVDDDFFIAQAVGDAVARRPRRDLEAIAVACMQHSHPQAAEAGARAVAAIAALE